MVVGNGLRGVSAGANLRLPTGDNANLLGAGGTALRMLAVGTWEDGQLALHLNGGVGVGGVSNEQFWNMATTLAVTPRITVVGEIMGRRLGELSRIADVYEPHATQPGLEVMRWLPTNPGVHSAFFVTGAKSIPRVEPSAQRQPSDAPYRSRPALAGTPSISLDYAFDR